jgi:hypothetical protein
MTTLRASDFKDCDGLNMWESLVDDAVLHGILPTGTSADEVEEIQVKALSMTMKEVEEDE